MHFEWVSQSLEDNFFVISVWHTVSSKSLHTLEMVSQLVTLQPQISMYFIGRFCDGTSSNGPKVQSAKKNFYFFLVQLKRWKVWHSFILSPLYSDTLNMINWKSCVLCILSINAVVLNACDTIMVLVCFSSGWTGKLFRVYVKIKCT